MLLLQKLKLFAFTPQKAKHYVVYAAGEIAIIVAGILIALYLQNNNQEQKDEQLFQANLQQMYNAATVDLWMFELLNTNLNEQYRLSKQLLANPDSIADQQLPTMLYYLDVSRPAVELETRYFADQLAINPYNQRHNEMLKQVTSFTRNPMLWSPEESLIVALLQRHNIPRPGLIFGLSGGMNVDFWINDIITGSTAKRLDFYSAEEIATVRQLVKQAELQALIRSKMLLLLSDMLQTFNYREDAVSILTLIKEYKPDVYLRFEDVGLVGSAALGWGQSVPLQLVNKNLALWQGRVTLKDGAIKFRSRNSWTYNWGATAIKDAAAGKLLYYGADIAVTAGTYDVEVNLSEQSYKLSRVN